MKNNCRATDKQLGVQLGEHLGRPPLHESTICNYRNKVMPEMGLEKWTVKRVSIRGENANKPEKSN